MSMRMPIGVRVVKLDLVKVKFIFVLSSKLIEFNIQLF